jgi:hypothetical protein
MLKPVNQGSPAEFERVLLFANEWQSPLDMNNEFHIF